MHGPPEVSRTNPSGQGSDAEGATQRPQLLERSVTSVEPAEHEHLAVMAPVQPQGGAAWFRMKK